MTYLFLNRCLRKSCSKLYWDDLLFSFKDDKLFVLVVLEGLVNIKAAGVTWDERQIDGIELHRIFKNIVHDSYLFTKSDLPLCDENAQKLDSGIVYKLMFKFDGRIKNAEFVICYDSSTKNLMCFK